MTCEEVRLSLGVHALGALDPEEALEIDTHLATCEVCGAELLELEGVTAFLGKVSERDVELVASPPRQVLDRLLNDRAKRSRRGRVLMAVAACAAVLVVGGTVWTTTQGGQMSSTGAAAPQPAAKQGEASASEAQEDSGPFVLNDSRKASPEAAPTASPRVAAAGKEFTGTNKSIKATVMALPGKGGTDLNVSVTGVPIGTTCRLIVFGSGGERETIEGWEISRENYEDDKAAVFPRKTKLALKDISYFEFRDQDGTLLVKTKV